MSKRSRRELWLNKVAGTLVGVICLVVALNSQEWLSGSVKRQCHLKVLTLNVRVDLASDSLNNWQYRRDSIGALVRQEAFDLIGTQEVLQNQLADLLLRLPGYGYLGVGRSDGKTAGEYSAIFYRLERFSVDTSGNFWLSETPEVPGSRSWDAACERIVTWGILQDQLSGLKLALFNTHFDHKGQEARLRSAYLLMDWINQIAGQLPVILTGDFNGTPESEPIKIILASGRVRDSRQLSAQKVGPAWSFHGFGKVPIDKRELLDFIFVSPPFEVLEYHNVYAELGGTYYSDHNPVWVKLRIPPAK